MLFTSEICVGTFCINKLKIVCSKFIGVKQVKTSFAELHQQTNLWDNKVIIYWSSDVNHECSCQKWTRKNTRTKTIVIAGNIP